MQINKMKDYLVYPSKILMYAPHWRLKCCS